MRITRHQQFLLVMLLAGSMLRLVWPGDMEWKTDEKLIYGLAHQAAEARALPDVGIKSGGGIVNPGLSVGVFALFATFTKDPVGMVQLVQWLNVLALLGFAASAWYRSRGVERDIWLNGMALAAVSPLAVLFARKIWAQDLLPAISFVIILAHGHRDRSWGAFLWGLAGALMGQVHMSGFYFAFGLFAVTVVHDRVRGLSFRWVAWLAGSGLGAVTMVAWLVHLAQHPQPSTASPWNMLQLNFYFYWIIDAMGLDSMYSLRDEFWDLLREPVISGVPTYFMAVLHLAIIGITVIYVKELVGVIRRAFSQMRAAGSIKDYCTNMSDTRLQFHGILLGLGVMMPLSGVTIYQHYLICAFPFTYVFAALVLKHHRRLLIGLMLAQLLITVGSMWYIHRNGGAPEGDYGITYDAQQRALR